MGKSPETSDSGQTVPVKMREKHDAVMALLEPFCRAHLNDEYFVVIKRLLGVLARKRPSPLVNGTPTAWACGIVRTIGWVNFLDDPAQKPHMKMTAVDKAFGVSSGTGQAKSKMIRDMLKIGSFDPDWTLPSRLADNPLLWMIQVNGMIVDVRSMPREIQEEAFSTTALPEFPKRFQPRAFRGLIANLMILDHVGGMLDFRGDVTAPPQPEPADGIQGPGRLLHRQLRIFPPEAESFARRRTASRSGRESCV